MANHLESEKKLIDDINKTPQQRKREHHLRNAVAATIFTVGAAVGVGANADGGAAEVQPKTETSQDMGREAGQLAGTELTGVQTDPASKEQALYENSEDFANNDGSGAVKAERQANDSEVKAEIGDAIAAVKGPNGETIQVDPVTGESLPDQPEG